MEVGRVHGGERAGDGAVEPGDAERSPRRARLQPATMPLRSLRKSCYVRMYRSYCIVDEHAFDS